MKQNVIWGMVAVLVLVVGVNFPLNGTTVTERVIEKVGGSTANSARQFFGAGVTVGGNVLSTTTTVTSYLLTTTELAGKTVVKINPSVDLALKLDATSTGQFVPNVGDTATIFIKNASTTVASAITLSAQNASLDLNLPEATGGDLVLAGLNWGRIDLIRNTLDSSTNSVTAILSEYIPD